MYARVSFYDMGSVSRDEAVRAFEGTQSTVEQMEGIRGAMLLVSTEEDKAITITFWDSEEALRATAEQAQAAREQSAGVAGMTVRDVGSYEVGIDFGR